MPKLAAPCRMGRSKPAALARWGSAWSGFSSPLSRYRSARLGGVGRSQIFSGAACGTGCGAGVSVALPPNPPCLRANVLLSTVATGAPSSPIRSRVFWMMAALPGPLSMTSLTRGRLTSFASDAEGGVGHAAWPAQHHRHGGKCREPGALVHEFELARIERVHADADAERIENALALPVAHADVARPVGHDPFVIEIRFRQRRLPCPQFAMPTPGRERFRAQAPFASPPPDPR